MQAVQLVGHTKNNFSTKTIQFCSMFPSPMSSYGTFSCSSSGGVTLASAHCMDHSSQWHPGGSVDINQGEPLSHGAMSPV